MLIIEHCVETAARPETVWALYQDVSAWPLWDKEVEYAKLLGPFALGTKGKLKPVGGPEVPFEITHLEPFKIFSDTSYVPLGTLMFMHTLKKQANGKTEICHKVEIKGFLKYFWAFVIGRNIKKGLPHAMQSLAALAEKKEANERK
ncbi:MAG: SRPBCC family protein [Candidatus Babeliales bacterium]